MALVALVACSATPAGPTEESAPVAAPVAIPAAAPVVAPDPGPLFTADFTEQADGPPADPRIVLYDNSRGASAAHPLTVIDGALQTQATEGLAGTYAEVDMAGPVTRVGAEFEFTGGTQRGGAISLPVWTKTFSDSQEFVPDSPSHLVLTADGWGYSVYENNHQVGLAEGTFDSPLPSNTPLLLDIHLAGDTATVDLPDGTTATVTDPRIANPGQFATFESFQWDSATMARTRLLRVWADA